MTHTKRICSNLKSRSIEITTACAVALVFIGLLGFAMTTIQLNMTQRALKASNAYQIQKDARDIATDVYSTGVLRKAILNDDLTPEENQQLHSNLWRMFNFYLSVFRQQQASGIGSDFSMSFQSDFCGLMERPSMISRWDEMVENENLSNSHVAMKENWCG